MKSEDNKWDEEKKKENEKMPSLRRVFAKVRF